MSESSEHLEAYLQPSLDTAAAVRPIYSTQASFLVAFFGGIFAILLFSALNVGRLGRWRQDTWILALASIVGVAVVSLLGSAAVTGNVPESLAILGAGTTGVRNLSRLLALAVFGVFFFRHRSFLKAQELAGSDPPSPWLPGFACAGVSIVLTIGLVAALRLVEQAPA